MLYTSEMTGKSYKTVKELEDDEAKAKEAQAEKAKKSEEKKARAEEVQAAYEEYLKVREDALKSIRDAEEKYDELRSKFADDYGGYHMTYINDNGHRSVTFGDIVDTLFSW
jgi:hypothetical protein